MANDEPVDINREGRLATIANFVDGLSGFLGLIIFANVLGASGLGLYYIATSIAVIAARPAGGLGLAVEKHGSANAEELNTFTSTGGFVAVLYAVAVTALAGVAYHILPFHVPLPVFIAALGLFCALCAYSLLNRAYSGIGETGRAVSLDAARGIIQTIFQVLLLWVGLGAVGLLLGTIFATLLAIGYLLNCTPLSLTTPTRDAFHTLWKFAKWSIPTEVSRRLYRNADTVIIGLLLSPTAVGFYEAAIRLLVPARHFAMGIQRPLLVRASQDQSSGSDTQSLLDSVAPYASLLAVPMLAGGIVIGKDLLALLYDPSFVAGYPILVGGALYYVFATHSRVLSGYLHGVNVPQTVTASTVLGSGTRAVATVGFILLFGLPGVALSIVGAELVRFSALSYGLRRITGAVYIPRQVLTQVISATAMAGVVGGFASLAPISTRIHLGALLAIGATVYFGGLVLLDSQVRTTVRKWFNALRTYAPSLS